MTLKKRKSARLIVEPRLQEIMRDKRFNQEQLSEKSGVSQSTISRFDRCRMHQSWILFALSAALECSVEDLFTIREEG